MTLKDGTAVESDAVFAQVDRAAFIPARIWFDDENGRPQPIDRVADPQAAVRVAGVRRRPADEDI